MSAPAYNAWNPRKRRIPGKPLPSAATKWKSGPVIDIKTLCAIKGPLTVTATWHRTQGCWQLVSFPKPLCFLKDCHDYIESQPLLNANGWSSQWYDSYMSLPVPILELEHS